MGNCSMATKFVFFDYPTEKVIFFWRNAISISFNINSV